MEKDKNIRDILGIKQQEIAILLKVTRSQWSLYEIGKRDLPIAAKLKLAEMLAFMQKSDARSEENYPHLKIQEQKRLKVLEKQMIVNQHKQMIAQKKLKSITKKYEAAMNALKLIDFLKTQSSKKTKEDNLTLNQLKTKADNDIQKNGLDIQAKQEILLQ